MKLRSLASFALLSAAISAVATAQERRSIGIPPFDLAAVEGSGVEARMALATLVRVEMLKNKDLNPQTLTLPRGVQPPLPARQAAELGRGSDVQYVVLGTVLTATVARSSNRASKGGFGGVIGAVSASVSRVTAKVAIHTELVNAATGESEGFEVSANNTDVGVGTNFHTTLGAFGAGDEGWQKTPMGKALREAAQKLVAEVAKRTLKPAGT